MSGHVCCIRGDSLGPIQSLVRIQSRKTGNDARVSLVGSGQFQGTIIHLFMFTLCKVVVKKKNSCRDSNWSLPFYSAAKVTLYNRQQLEPSCVFMMFYADDYMSLWSSAQRDCVQTTAFVCLEIREHNLNAVCGSVGEMVIYVEYKAIDRWRKKVW